MSDIVRLPKYEYLASFYENYDGDSFWFQVHKKVDMGFNIISEIHFKINVRLYGGDTYEMRDKDTDKRAKAVAAQALVENLLTQAESIKLRTHRDKTGKYGRYLATILYRLPGRKRHYNLLTLLRRRGLLTGKYEK